jgi:hypothetical protein
MSTNEPFWYKDPNILFQKDTWYAFVPQPNMTVRASLNAVVRFSVYLSMLLFATSRDPWYLLMIPGVMAITVFLHGAFPEAKKILTETFTSGPVVTGYTGGGRTLPTPDNPFMNPTLTDILDNPDRPPAAEITTLSTRDKINQAFAQTSNIYMDTTDLFSLIQSQRNFHAVPADDHAGFLKFLGKNGQRTNQKGLSEGFVVAKGTVTNLPLPSVSAPPVGAAPQQS